MKIFIVTTPSSNVLTKDHIKEFKKFGSVAFIDKPQPFKKIKELYEGDEEKIIAVDPDFCAWKIPDSVLKTVPNLKAICLKTTSFNWVNTKLASKLGITVTNSKGWPAPAVVEWIIMTSFLLARKMPLMIKEGWRKDFSRYLGTELKGKTAGILGMGTIGTLLAHTCAGLGMNVTYWSKHSRDTRFTYTSINTIITTSDFIYPVWANNEETKTLLPISLLKKVNPKGYFVDIYIAGDTHDRKTLIDMAEKGKIRGYGFEAESGEFLKYKGNIAAIPENGWTTAESLKRNARLWSDAIANAAKGKYPAKVN